MDLKEAGRLWALMVKDTIDELDEYHLLKKDEIEKMGALNKTYTIDAKTPRGQAEQVAEAIMEMGKVYGYSEELMKIEMMEPQPAQEYVDRHLHIGPSEEGEGSWAVGWESGPNDWAVRAACGGNAFTINENAKPTFDFAPHVQFDNHYGFDFIFYNEA
jgi:hypothetical protein